ncbi:LOW QUALITY PROTEIN: phospholipid-transporting ATPase ABCA3 [Drosophila obscura]|uniref:LOW QUALITY PROTEIN: phospholipid-transporting ATPase ABCA3 n=1 Tax=Drosophila obscura TaxID=7282 RepID=UPI001BB17458|nr:LOW QUALITY PROTEIN: phospholipid-transporting ATPase ABCA3 [Drosophila obscura]
MSLPQAGNEPIGDWQKLKLLLWKNWTLQWNQKIQLIFALALPVIFLLLIVVLRVLVEPESMPVIRYPPVSISDMNLFQKSVLHGNLIMHDNGTLNIPKNILCYTPDSTANRAIITAATMRLRLLSWRSYDTASHMEYDLVTHNYLAGVEFVSETTSALNEKGFAYTFNYRLRFPSELRTMYGPIIETWRTSNLFPNYDMSGPRNMNASDGGVPVGYVMEGFLPLQHALTMSWLQLSTGRTSEQLPQIHLQRFPYRSYIYDPLLSGLQQLLSFIILLSFIYPCSFVAKHVTNEKELQLKDIMKLMGIHNWIHWLAWFIKSYAMLMIVVVLLMCLLLGKYYKSVAILTHSHWLPLLVFLHTYVFASICFCFMIAVFISKASTSAAATSILWFITYIPYSFSFYYYDRLNLATKLVLCLLMSNTALGFGFHVIMAWEGTGEGARWHNMFQPVSLDDSLSLIYVICMLSVGGLIYLTVCLYVEQICCADTAMTRRWYYPFRRTFWSQLLSHSDSTQLYPAHPLSSPINLNKRNPNIGIQLCNLHKSYGKHKAVNGLNLKMYRNEITVLLGQNGAGKTTTIHMLTGIVQPSAGTALLNGYDIRSQLAAARRSLGICPQQNILFDQMTVRDHIKFFSQLKGVRGPAAVSCEVSKYMRLLELEDKSRIAARKLSGGMKRKLSLCCALCGNTSIVLCDEASAGVDAAGRRSLWELLQAEKIGRTVLLTTHYMDEADVLGDRIAILCDGKLKCYGSSFYLKKRYGIGYRLICVKQKSCNVAEVTQLLHKHLPAIQLESEFGSEIAYLLPSKHSKKYPDLLSALEQQSNALKLDGYGVSVTTLEDVFMQVSHIAENEAAAAAAQPQGEEGFNDLFTDMEMKEKRWYTRCYMRWQALFLKKALITGRNYWLLLVQILLPILIMSLTILNSKGGRIYYELPAMKISLHQYPKAFVIFHDETNEQMPSLATAYAEHLSSYGLGYSLINRSDDASMEEYILGIGKNLNRRIDFQYLAGLSIGTDNLTVWLNNKPLHTAPLTLNLLHNALAVEMLGKQARTGVTNAPLPYNNQTLTLRLNKGQRLGAEIAINLGLCMSIITALYVIPIIKERETRAKLMQFLTGVDVFAYWISQLLWDYAVFSVSALMAILTISAFQEPGYSTVSDLGLYYAILLLFGLAALPLSYTFSGFFCDGATGFTRTVIATTLTGTGLFMLVLALSFEAFQLKHIAVQLAWYFRVFPHYCLASAIHHIHIGFNIRRGCSFAGVRKLPTSIRCRTIPVCCNIPGYFDWPAPGVLPEILYLCVVAVILLSLLMICDAKICTCEAVCCKPYRLLCSIGKRRRVQKGESTFDNDDVKRESFLVKNMTQAQRKLMPLLVDGISKRYGNSFVVKDLSFHVTHAECFGLLGINGAGKTTTFRMLTGDARISAGFAYVEGRNLCNKMHKVYEKIGYCPQFDALFDDLTGRQTLRIYCLLQGVQRRHVAEVCSALSVYFGFHPHIDKLTKHYSGGNKRKLSAAISIIGNPSILYLDEPTSGMDPAARRQIWRRIAHIRAAGKSIVLTSHSMDECETLCTRLAIMVDGQFKCIGSVQNLKNRYSKGLILKMKIKHSKRSVQRPVDSSSSSEGSVKRGDEVTRTNNNKRTAEINIINGNDLANRILKLKNFISKAMPDAMLKENCNGMLTYYIPLQQLMWSKLFRLIENNRDKLYIEDYLIIQTRLEEIFLDFALKRDQSGEP